MTARLRKLLAVMAETFWILPGAMVLAGVLLAIGLVSLDRGNLVPTPLIDSPWLYDGGATGARTLLGAVASSTIGVAGTVFSITIAALSLAAGQMGPRLLRNFTRDRGNQATLGAFLGTFSYVMMVLRSVRTSSEGEFVPHLALTVGILLAFICVATLVFFVGHMAGRINVDTVIDAVSADIRTAVRRLMQENPSPPPPPASHWRSAAVVTDRRHGYLQQLDSQGLADWATRHETSIRLLVRPGDYVFPGAPVALVAPPADGAADAIVKATAVGGQRISDDDLEFSLRQLVDVAVRALSPAINDPHTAISVLDRLGSALCDAAPLHLSTGVMLANAIPVLVVPATDYGGLVDTMFNMIRQNAASSPAVLIRMIEVLTIVAGCERDSSRLAELRRHAGLVLADAQRSVPTPADLRDIGRRYRRFAAIQSQGPLPAVLAGDGDANAGN